MLRQLALAAGLLAAMPVSAQDAIEPGGTSPRRACELHVWPSPDLHLAYIGWVKASARKPAANGPLGPLPANLILLSAKRQAERLRGLPLAQIVGLPDYVTIVHDQPLDNVALRRTSGRQLADAPQCYAELAMPGTAFQYDFVTGKALNMVFRFRRFDGDGPATDEFGTFMTTKLDVTLEGQDAMTTETFLGEIERGFDADVRAFGAALQRPRKAKR